MRRPAHPLVLAVLCGLTTLSALAAWRDLVTYPWAYLGAAAVLAAVLAVVGAALDRRLPWWAVVGCEALLCLVAVVWVASGSLIPFHGHAPLGALHRAIVTARDSRSPAGRSLPSLTPMLFLGSAVALLVVQAVAVHLRRPPLAGLALLAIFALPSGAIGGDRGALPFTGAATGFLLLLLLDAHDNAGRWARASRAATSSYGGAIRSLRTGVPVGAVAIGAAVLVAATVPLPHDGVLGKLGFDGSGDGQVTIHKPLVDMRGDLLRRYDAALVELTTDDPDPSYLRLAVLNRFTGEEWTSGDRDVENHADGALPLSPGLSPDVPLTSYDVRAHVLPTLDSTWLPTLYPISHIEAAGDWRYDPATSDVIAADGTNAEGLTYSMTAEVPDYGTDGRWFGDALPDAVPDEDLEVPAQVSASVRDLAMRVTRGARDDYQRALRLQAYFRDSGLFHYSVRRSPVGDGADALATFLSPSGRVGYCQQFASAMAVMARIVGVPARVAVGFLRPHRIGPDQWRYGYDDLHAWPELYFQGAGWVRFEPTPSVRAKVAPPYSTVAVGHPTPSGTHHDGHHAPGPKLRQGPKQHPKPTRNPRVLPTGTQPTVSHHARSGSGGAAWVVWLGSLLLVLVLLAAAPVVVRRRQRAHRRSGDPEAVWAELRSTAIDLRVPWPDDRSPREVRAALAPTMAGDEPPLDDLDRIVERVEQSRYAGGQRAALAVRSELGVEAQHVIAALHEAAAPRERRLATWLPRSLWRG